MKEKGKRKGKYKTEEMGNSLNYREIHFLIHTKINILNWKIGAYEYLILYNAKIPLKILKKAVLFTQKTFHQSLILHKLF